MSKIKPNAWLVRNPTKEEANAMFFVFYTAKPWFGDKRKETYARKMNESWRVLLADIDISSVDDNQRISVRRISQYGNEYMLYTSGN